MKRLVSDLIILIMGIILLVGPIIAVGYFIKVSIELPVDLQESKGESKYEKMVRLAREGRETAKHICFNPLFKDEVKDVDYYCNAYQSYDLLLNEMGEK